MIQRVKLITWVSRTVALFAIIVAVAGMGQVVLKDSPGLPDAKPLLCKWKRIFGPIDLTDPDVVNSLAYINPQPESVFRDFDQKRFIEHVLLYGFRTGADYFFKEPYQPPHTWDIDELYKQRRRSPLPKKYLLPKHGPDAGLLWYEWKVAPYSFRMIENGNGVLVRIRPRGFNPKAGITSAELLTLIRTVFDLERRPGVYDPVARPEEVALKRFRMPDILRIGDTFSNAGTGAFSHVTRCGAWQDHVVGFISKEDICVMCFKSQAVRQRMFFYYQPSWLAERLVEPDGETYVATGQKDASIVEQRRQAEREKLSSKLPRNPTQLAELLKHPDPEFRHRLLQQLAKPGIPAGFFEVIAKHYDNETDVQCRRQVAFSMTDHPVPTKALDFFRTALGRETDPETRDMIRDFMQPVRELADKPTH